MSEPALLSIRDLSVRFSTNDGELLALDRVSLEVPAGRAVALVGESGCGKSVTALSILRLLPPNARVDGAIVLEGRDVLTLSRRELREVRGGRVGMVFQEPMTSLNPVYTAGAQIAEALRLHLPLGRGEANRRAVELLRRVGVADAEQRVRSYPHELSGGMRQRVMIAIALACEPALVVADEPTTALDMVTQAQILELFAELRRKRSASLLLVTHDVGVVSETADDLVVLYAGQVVERGPAREVLDAPEHPYTRALLASLPPRGVHRVRGGPRRRLPVLEGALPDPFAPPVGCRFAARCPEALARCVDEAPPLFELGGEREARCWLAEPAKLYVAAAGAAS